MKSLINNKCLVQISVNFKHSLFCHYCIFIVTLALNNTVFTVQFSRFGTEGLSKRSHISCKPCNYWIQYLNSYLSLYILKICPSLKSMHLANML